ncbi:MAG: helix-turn-helix transcriptional regulator [Candidatus Tectimicrobiota bacterium]
MDDKLLTPEQAAALLNLKSKTLARWRWAGYGPRFIKIGGAVRYAAHDLQAFIKAGVRISTSDQGPGQHDR